MFGMGSWDLCEIGNGRYYRRCTTATGAKRRTEVHMPLLVRSCIADLITAVFYCMRRQFITARCGAECQKNNAQYDSKVSHWNKNSTFRIAINNYYNNIVAISTYGMLPRSYDNDYTTFQEEGLLIGRRSLNTSSAAANPITKKLSTSGKTL
jgi:hypothetical protein